MKIYVIREFETGAWVNWWSSKALAYRAWGKLEVLEKECVLENRYELVELEVQDEPIEIVLYLT